MLHSLLDSVEIEAFLIDQTLRTIPHNFLFPNPKVIEIYFLL